MGSISTPAFAMFTVSVTYLLIQAAASSVKFIPKLFSNDGGMTHIDLIAFECLPSVQSRIGKGAFAAFSPVPNAVGLESTRCEPLVREGPVYALRQLGALAPVRISTPLAHLDDLRHVVPPQRQRDHHERREVVDADLQGVLTEVVISQNPAGCFAEPLLRVLYPPASLV